MTPEQTDEVHSDQVLWVASHRPAVMALEEIMYEVQPVLDHGFVRVVDYMGDDRAIVQAARVSYGSGTRKPSEDAALINYLMRHRHTTPFEMNEIKLHVKLPIFVARQWIRHRTASTNEVSARYSILDKEFYIPAPGHLAEQSTDNKQGRGKVLGEPVAEAICEILRYDANQSYDNYTKMLDRNVARELARMNLSLNFYTQWYWKTDLHNLFNFLALRCDEHAQYEIRAYANVILEIVSRWCPMAYNAFLEHRLNAVTLPGSAMMVVTQIMSGEKVTQDTSGLSPREWRELMKTIGKPEENSST